MTSRKEVFCYVTQSLFYTRISYFQHSLYTEFASHALAKQSHQRLRMTLILAHRSTHVNEYFKSLPRRLRAPRKVVLWISFLTKDSLAVKCIGKRV